MIPKIIRNLFTPDVSLSCEIEHNFTQKVEAFRKMPKLMVFARLALNGLTTVPFIRGEQSCKYYNIRYVVHQTPRLLQVVVSLRGTGWEFREMRIIVNAAGNLEYFSAYPSFLPELHVAVEKFMTVEIDKVAAASKALKEISLADCHKET